MSGQQPGMEVGTLGGEGMMKQRFEKQRIVGEDIPGKLTIPTIFAMAGGGGREGTALLWKKKLKQEIAEIDSSTFPCQGGGKEAPKLFHPLIIFVGVSCCRLSPVSCMFNQIKECC